MSGCRPRFLAHRGSVRASGFLVCGDEPDRWLRCVRPGVTLRQMPEGILVLLPHPVRTLSYGAPGAPLVVIANGVLATAPLSAGELRQLGAGPGDVVTLSGGVARRAALASLPPVDPAAALDLGAVAHVSTRALAPPPPPPLAPVTARFDARSRLNAPPADPEAASVLEALHQRASRGSPAARGARATPWIGWVIARLRARWSVGPGGEEEAPRPRGPSPRWAPGRLATSLRSRLAELLRSSGMASLLGQRQAAYIARTMRMFRDGDLDAALRHAIPLGQGPAGPPALGVPSPRDALSLTRSSAATLSIALGEELYRELRSLYRDAFERLRSEGRIEEAAFVMAELMDSPAEAVALLEREGRLALAAELSGARDLDPALTVRLWFLAGERERALDVARRTGAFAPALVALERKHPAEARLFRMVWAERLAEAGDHAGAADVAWPVPEARGAAGRWLDLAIAQGGPTGARMLARKLLLDPSPAMRDACRALLEERDPAGATSRLALVQALVMMERTPASSYVARTGVRAVLRDAGHLQGRVTRDAWRRLLHHSGDACLRADAPPLPDAPTGSLAARNTPLLLTFPHGESGTIPCFDAALLPGGRMAVALGEAGVRLLTRDGRTAAHVDEPAHSLILSTHGNRAIAVARRGELQRLSIVDFAAGRARAWADAQLTAWAETFDGTDWFVAHHDVAMALDATKERLEAVWREGGFDDTVVAIARGQRQVALLLAGWGLDILLYEQPRMRLRERIAIEKGWRGEIGIEPHMAIDAEGAWLDVSRWADRAEHRVHPLPPAARLFTKAMGARTIPVLQEGDGLLAPAISGAWLAVAVTRPGAVHIFLADRASCTPRAELRLEGATTARVRLDDETLVAADDRGRVVAIALGDGAVLRSLRTV